MISLPKRLATRLAVAGLLAGIGLAAVAQTPQPPPAAPQGHERMAKRHDPAKMQERMAKRQAALKEKLKITASQEGAWSSFTAAMAPPANRPARPDRAEFEKLSTPERIDRMRAMHERRTAEMTRRGDATKTFYAALSPDQQKVFDSETLRFGRGGRHGGHHGPRG